MDQTHAPSSKIRPRGWGLPIGVWLILGFVFIIGAFVTANILAQRSTENAKRSFPIKPTRGNRANSIVLLSE